MIIKYMLIQSRLSNEQIHLGRLGYVNAISQINSQIHKPTELVNVK